MLDDRTRFAIVQRLKEIGTAAEGLYTDVVRRMGISTY